MVILRMTESGTGGLWEMAGVMLMTVGVFVLAWLTARFLARRTRHLRRGGRIHVEDRLTVGRDRQILLIRVGQDRFLAGQTPHHIGFSERLSAEEADVVMEGEGKEGDLDAASGPPTLSFRSILTGLSRGREEPK